jgi:hypothetical protein
MIITLVCRLAACEIREMKIELDFIFLFEKIDFSFHLSLFLFSPQKLFYLLFKIDFPQ